MFGRNLFITLLLLFIPLYAYETPQMFVHKVLKRLKKEHKHRNTLALQNRKFLDTSIQKDSTIVTVMQSDDSEKSTILVLKQSIENGSGLVETTEKSYYILHDSLYLIEVNQTLKNTFVKVDPFFSVRRIFIRGDEIVSSMYKQGTEKFFRREKFYEQQKGSSHWLESQRLFDQAVAIKEKVLK